MVFESTVYPSITVDICIPVPDYDNENVSDKVVKDVQSYGGFVNSIRWYGASSRVGVVFYMS